MHTTAFRSTVAGLGVAALLAFSPAAFAEVQNYSAVLNAASEVPAADSKGTGALTATAGPDRSL